MRTLAVVLLLLALVAMSNQVEGADGGLLQIGAADQEQLSVCSAEATVALLAPSDPSNTDIAPTRFAAACMPRWTNCYLPPVEGKVCCGQCVCGNYAACFCQD